MTEHAAATPSQIKSTGIPNSPFPTRILKLIRDEEEWFSGSELKTDNSSSSDDEMSPTSQNLNTKFNKIKKRRKSKVNFKDCIEKRDDDSISTASAGTINTGSGLNETSSTKILRGTGDEKHVNLLCTSIAESDEDDSEIYWRPKRETASLNLLRDHPDLSDSFIKTEKLLEDVSNIDQADDTVIEATKRMKNLEWDLLQAECRFEKEKGATDKVANDMLEYLNEITPFEGDAWNYIRSVIKQWIYYLKLHEVEPELNDERFVSQQRKRNYKSLVRNRTKGKLGFIDKNIEAARLTKLKSNIRLPKLTKEDKVQLDELVKNSKNFALNEYKLQKSELDRLKEINSKLSLHRLESGASVVLNSWNEDEVKLDKLNKKSKQIVLHEYNLQNCELEKLKNIDYKLSAYKRHREDKDTNLNTLYKDESQLDELCKQFAIHEYNLPKFEYQKLKALNSKMLTKNDKQNNAYEPGYQNYHYEIPPENRIIANGLNNNSEHNAHYDDISQNVSFMASTHRNIKIRDALPQIMASLIAFMVVIQVGVNMSYSSVIIQQLNATDSPITITTDEASWIASLVTITLPIGALITGPIMDTYGRKTLTLISCVPFIVAWIMIGTTNSVYVIYLARIITGAAGGLTNVALVYVSEITHPTLRPMMLSFNSVFVSLGILITSGLSLILDWRGLAFFYCGMAVITLLVTFVIPESPHWIRTFKSDRNDLLYRSLKWTYRDDILYQYQLQQLIGSVTQPTKVTSKFRLKDLKEKTVYKPLIILTVLLLFQQLSGVYAVIFYALNIFVKIRKNFDGISDYQTLLLLGVLRFIMSFVAALCSRNLGRRTMMCTSGVGMSLCTLLAGVTMIFKSEQNDLSAHQEIVLLICVLGFVCFGSLGFLVIPWTLTTELLPTKVKATLSGLMISIGYVLMFAIIKIFPYTLEWLGIQQIFFIISITSVLGVIFVYLYLPETLGRSFSEIEKYFR